MVFLLVVMPLTIIASVLLVAAFVALGGTAGQHGGAGIGATNASDIIDRCKAEEEMTSDPRLRRISFSGVITDLDFREHRLANQKTVTIPAVQET